MATDEPLLDIAAALADGTAVDWESAAQSITNDDERRLLAELRFIADMARTTRDDSSVITSAFQTRSEPRHASSELHTRQGNLGSSQNHRTRRARNIRRCLSGLGQPARSRSRTEDSATH